MKNNRENFPGSGVCDGTGALSGLNALKNYAYDTRSICPVCMKTLRARRVRKSGGIFLERECPEHGFFSAVVWRDKVDFEAWTQGARRPDWEEAPRCPAGCEAGAGICGNHMAGTCCAVLEVTKRCNLSCLYCFADGGSGADPSSEEITARMTKLVKPGDTLLQLSGGEPTLRGDLPEIIRTAKTLGCKYVQLNTNGLRLAEDPAYARTLADAGLSFVFLQFDGTRDDIYKQLRGAPLFASKEKAIMNCAAAGLGVTLVPTLVRGINDESLGEILRFAVAHSPAVRGIHLQPVGHLGRVPAIPDDRDRFTLDEVIVGLARQSCGLLKTENLLPSSCDHPMCGFHGDFIVLKDGALHPLSKAFEPTRTMDASERAGKNREFVGRRWQSPKTTCCCGSETAETPGDDMEDLDTFLSRAKTYGFTITAMAFQDAGNLDLERLRSCSLHVFADDALRPFCAHYIRHA